MKGIVYAMAIPAAALMIADDGRNEKANSGRPPDGRTIQEWIDRLGDDRFTVREAASNSLVEMGKQALPVVMEAAVDEDTEVRSRAFRVLAKLAHSADEDVAGPAVAASETLAKSERRATAAAANSALRWYHLGARTREQNAVAALTRMHAVLQPDQFGRVKSCNLSLFPIPKDGLIHLKGLANLETLDLFATGVSDARLAHLKGLAKLKTLRLGATTVTDEGVKNLRKALPNSTIYH